MLWHSCLYAYAKIGAERSAGKHAYAIDGYHYRKIRGWMEIFWLVLKTENVACNTNDQDF